MPRTGRAAPCRSPPRSRGRAPRARRAISPPDAVMSPKPEAPQGMVSDRMARGRTRTDQVFPLHSARDHQPPSVGGRDETALADRAGLPGSQAGARSWPIRRTRLARLSSSCHAVHRRLWIPALRKGSLSPLRTQPRRSQRRISPTRRLSTPRIPRSDLSVTCQIRSHPSGSPSPAQSPAPCPAARAANAPHSTHTYDTVRLRGCLETPA